MLEGKTAVVTGASSGIGQAAARLFAAEGARVALGGRRRTALEALAAEIEAGGGAAVTLAGDLREDGYAEALTARAVAAFGGLDIAFDNAGALGELAPAAELSAQAWRETLEINLTGAFLCARSQIPAMLARGGGAIVFTGSFVGCAAGLPGMAAYAAAKAGLIGLTQVLAAEYGAQGLRVNALLSGGADTPMGRSAAGTPEARAYVEGLHALGRIAAPEEIARAALFLASDAASFVTGAAIAADGGVSIFRR